MYTSTIFWFSSKETLIWDFLSKFVSGHKICRRQKLGDLCFYLISHSWPFLLERYKYKNNAQMLGLVKQNRL